MEFVRLHLHGLTISKVNKRVHIASGCLHAAVEHGMAMLILVERGLHGSALALARLQFEAYVRGSWLAKCATDKDVDRAGRDRFPKFEPMVADFETKGLGSSLAGIKQKVWGPFNSLTHTGYQQIGPRLSPSEVGSFFTDKQVREVLWWAESIAILSALEFAILAGDDELARTLYKRVEESGAP
jgi:hypothetical protein